MNGLSECYTHVNIQYAAIALIIHNMAISFISKEQNTPVVVTNRVIRNNAMLAYWLKNSVSGRSVRGRMQLCGLAEPVEHRSKVSTEFSLLEY